jgi:hypothetical protein
LRVRPPGTSGISSHARDLLQRLLAFTRTWTFAVLLAVAYFAYGFLQVARGALLSEVGFATYLFSACLSHDPVPQLFLLKIKPGAALLMFPGAVFGFRAFLHWNLLLGACGILAVAATARAWRLREPGLPPLVLATSPIYLADGASGVSNMSASVIGAVAIWILSAGRPGFLAGAILSLLPFVRVEGALLAAALGLWALWQRPSRWFWIGLAAVTPAYLLAGAVYHGQLLWPLAYPPVVADYSKMRFAAQFIDQVTPVNVIQTLMLVSPLIVLVLRPQPRGHRLATILAGFLAVFVAAGIVFPLLQRFFDFSERYFLLGLPAAALLAGRTLDLPRRAAAWSLAVAGLGLVVLALHPGAPAFALVLIAVGAAAALVTTAWQTPAVLALMLIPILWLWPHPPSSLTAVDTASIAARHWLERHPEHNGVRVYTNIPTLETYLRNWAGNATVDVRAILYPDIIEYVTVYANRTNGQSERLVAGLPRCFYAPPALASELLPDGAAPPGSLVLLVPNPRLSELLSDDLLRQRAQLIETTPEFTVWEIQH